MPPALGILASWWVIGISSVLFAIEFFADKIPAFDLVWNTLHTFIRVQWQRCWRIVRLRRYRPGSSWRRRRPAA